MVSSFCALPCMVFRFFCLLYYTRWALLFCNSFPLFFQIFFYFPWKISLFAPLCLLTTPIFYKFTIPLLSLFPLFYMELLYLCACSIQKLYLQQLSTNH